MPFVAALVFLWWGFFFLRDLQTARLPVVVLAIIWGVGGMVLLFTTANVVVEQLPALWTALWNSRATRKVRLLSQAMKDRFAVAKGCEWVNYIRVHDDIGWTFSDEDAALLGVKGYDHRQFLNQYYTGRFPGSFARGLPFQENPRTRDCRISGTCASLAGLEQALADTGPERDMFIGHALARVLLLHGIILSIGGIPLIYLGDEIGTLTDYAYHNDPANAGDSRWVHRPRTNWVKVARRTDAASIEGRLFGNLRRIIGTRLANSGLADGNMQVIETGNDHVLGYVRQSEGDNLLALANFAEHEQIIAASALQSYGLNHVATDSISGEKVRLDGDLELGPYQLILLNA